MTRTQAALGTLDDRVAGEPLEPGDAGYEDARAVWNARVDREPAAVSRCTGTADVMAGVDVAREHDLSLSIKGGGHHVSGSAVCDDGLVLDMGSMDGVRVDPTAKTARVGRGRRGETSTATPRRSASRSLAGRTRTSGLPG